MACGILIQRNKNIQSNNTSGYAGIDGDSKRHKWRARIFDLTGKELYLGRFSKLEDAVKTRKLVEKRYKYHNGSETIA